MNELEQQLQQFRQGKLDINDILKFIHNQGLENLGFARIDHARANRQGFPEVVYCEGKTPEQTAEIMQRLADRTPNFLATRASKEHFNAVQEKLPFAVYHQISRLITIEGQPLKKYPKRVVLVLSAGTSDLPVAEEAALTAEIMGNEVERIYDVGVAGLHRLFAVLDRIYQAKVVIVVAGMEGALASVVGGLISGPVIAVPTSVGYGSNLGGITPLLGMLNSCSAGIGVVNIDNGFGAGRLASIINHMR